MESKIIFFIDNDIEKVKGIFKCFVCDRNIGLEVYENEFCKTFLFNAVERDSNIQPILGQNGNNFLFISSRAVKLVSSLNEAPQDWNMLLVHDSVPVADVVPVFTPDTLVLYHRQPADAEKTLAKHRGKYNRAIKSMHEAGGEYALLFDIARIWRPDTGDFTPREFDTVFKKIAKELYNAKLESILEFLHDCLEYAPSDNEWEKLKEYTGIDVSDELKLKGDVGSEEYIQCLARLRNHLFENEDICQ